MTSVILVSIVMSVVGVSTPILLAALGELVVEKAGVLNLGIEGMMLIGAIAGFSVTLITGNPWLGVFSAMIAGACASLLFGYLTLSLTANQVATGLALTIFGISLSSLIGESFVGRTIPIFGSPFPSQLAAHPFLRLLFGHSPIVYFSLIMTASVWIFLARSRRGLVLRAIGESDSSAHSIGYPVIAVRYAAVLFGGAMAGVAGSYYSMVLTPMWAEQLTAGRGWIALALVVFAVWRPSRLLFGAYLFGLVMTLELQTKAAGFAAIPPEFMAALPYLATVVVLALISIRKTGATAAPACLGKPFKPTT